MPTNFPGSRDGRVRLESATGAFVVVIMVVGGVTRVFGVDAGLLALVLAVVALVLFPQLYGTPDATPQPGREIDRPVQDADPDDTVGRHADA